MLPSIDNLRCFLTAAQTLNFRAAARIVALTPAALGQRIRQLEDQLDIRLFERTTRAPSPSRARASRWCPTPSVLLAAAEDCARAARGDLGPPPIELVLGTRHELGLSWLLPQLESLSREHPWVTFHIYFGATEDLLIRLRTREVDCIVTSSRFADAKLDAVRLHLEHYVFVGARKLLGAQPFTHARHAANHTLIDASAELPLFRYFLDASDSRSPLVFKSIVRVGTIAGIEQLVSAGKGVAVLAATAATPCRHELFDPGDRLDSTIDLNTSGLRESDASRAAEEWQFRQPRSSTRRRNCHSSVTLDV